MQLTANSKEASSEASSKEDMQISPVLWIPKYYCIPQHSQKRILSGAMREMSMHASDSLLHVEWNPQTQWDDGPLISVRYFFCRKQPPGPQLLCKTYPSVFSPMVPAHSDMHSGYYALLSYPSKSIG